MLLSSSRIHAILVSVLLSSLAGEWASAADAQRAPPVVATPYGSVRGVWAQGVPDVVAYQGIPFAAAPTGALRWREPRAPAHWSGVRDSLAAVPACIQPLSGSRLPWTKEYTHQGAISEDCLFLNVWAPAAPSPNRLPVLVYIYGGGFNEGSIAVPIYDGASLASRHAVIVTVNYRVGLFGFLAHPDLTRESPHHASGNYGLLDQVAALNWVRGNIAAFGGDPGRVTVFGQSAGAMSVYLLTASPRAKGLFQRAIVQSGPGALAAFGITSVRALTQSRENAEQTGVKFATVLGAKSIAELRALDGQKLLAQLIAQMPTDGPPTQFAPDVDGWFLSADAETVYSHQQQNDVPLIIGMMADEGSAFPGYTPAKAIEARQASLASLDEVLTQRAAASHTPAYAYYFERAIPWPEHPEFAAFHSGELPYVFDNLRLLQRPWSGADRNLAKTVSSYWLSFAATGDPNNASGPAWPAYKPGSRTFMVLGEKTGERTLKH